MLNINFWITFLSAILSEYIYILIYKKLSLNNIKTKFLFFIIFLFSIIVTINNLYNNVLLKVLISFLLFLLLIKIVFHDNRKNIIYFCFFIFIFGMIIELILSVFLSLIFTNIYEFNSNILFKFFFSIFINYIQYFLSKIQFLDLKINEINKKISINSNIILYTILILIIINIIGSLYITNFIDLKYYILIFVFIIFLLVINYLFYKDMFDNKILKVKNLCLENNINNYEKSIDDYRILKHNLINDLLQIKCADKNNVNLIINNIINKYNKETNWVNSLNNIPNGIQGIIYAKMNLAEKNKIKMFIDNKIKLVNLKDKSKLYFNICEVLGICLDNAIESSSKSNDKIIYINLFNCDNEKFCIDIINTFSNNVDLDKIGNKNYSTKENPSGLGLNYISKLNKEIKIKKSIIDNMFRISIIFEKK